MTRVLKENPSQVETRYKVGDKLLTLKEKEDLEKKGFDTGAFEILRRLNLKAFSRKSQEEGYQGKPEEVYLKDILREHKGSCTFQNRFSGLTYQKKRNLRRMWRSYLKWSSRIFRST